MIIIINIIIIIIIIIIAIMPPLTGRLHGHKVAGSDRTSKIIAPRRSSIGIFTFTGWSSIGDNLSKFIPTNTCLKQFHTNQAPTNKGQHPYESYSP